MKSFLTFCILISILLFGCQEKSGKSAFSSHLLAADTICISMTNGSLAPNYQYELDYMVTEKGIIYEESKDGKLTQYPVKKIESSDWESLRMFGTSIVDKDDNLQIDGQETETIIFIVKKKKYCFLANSFAEKAIKIKYIYNN